MRIVDFSSRFVPPDDRPQAVGAAWEQRGAHETTTDGGATAAVIIEAEGLEPFSSAAGTT